MQQNYKSLRNIGKNQEIHCGGNWCFEDNLAAVSIYVFVRWEINWNEKYWKYKINVIKVEIFYSRDSVSY